MEGLLILYITEMNDRQVAAKYLIDTGRALGLEIRVPTLGPTPSFRKMMPLRLEAGLAATTHAGPRVVTLYHGVGAFKLDTLRYVLTRCLFAWTSRKFGVAFCTRIDISSEGPSRGLDRDDADDPTISPSRERRELVAAALANSHACRNWLADDAPNLERARASLALLIRDLGQLAEFV